MSIDRIIAECLHEMDKPLPKACHKTRECRMAGGCPSCYAEFLAEIRRRREFALHAYEEYRDRQEDHRVFGTPLPKIN